MPLCIDRHAKTVSADNFGQYRVSILSSVNPHTFEAQFFLSFVMTTFEHLELKSDPLIKRFVAPYVLGFEIHKTETTQKM